MTTVRVRTGVNTEGRIDTPGQCPSMRSHTNTRARERLAAGRGGAIATAAARTFEAVRVAGRATHGGGFLAGMELHARRRVTARNVCHSQARRRPCHVNAYKPVTRGASSYINNDSVIVVIIMIMQHTHQHALLTRAIRCPTARATPTGATHGHASGSQDAATHSPRARRQLAHSKQPLHSAPHTVAATLLSVTARHVGLDATF